MITDEQYRSLLARCLRLEAEIAILRGMDIAPTLPQIERRELPITPLPIRQRRRCSPVPGVRHIVPADEIAVMRELRRQGIGYGEIGRRTGWCRSTTTRHTRDVLLEREAGS